MPDDTAAPFLFRAVGRKKVIADFDGGRIGTVRLALCRNGSGRVAGIG